ncbi:MAG: hypothetical protein LUG89_01680 [Methanosphaera sp.]|nr:hypothetical protein [Methanosphaera sp.]
MSIMKLLSQVCDVYGVADLQIDKDRLIENYGEDILRYPYAIVIGHRMREDIIEKIPESYNDDTIAQEYLDEYYNSHQRVLEISRKIEKEVNHEGYNAIILDVGGNSDKLNLKRSFSNKASAHIAGVGWIGKNNLLTTKEYGPRLTWATILTDAPLSDYAGSPMDSQCSDCKMCYTACPGKAIKNISNPEESYSPEKCGEYIMARRDEGHPLACGMCLYICPYGNKKSMAIRASKS